MEQSKSGYINMERCSDLDFTNSSLRDEHLHRYQLAALLAHGTVVDCACGIGYGGPILAKNTNVNKYIGIDPAIEAIQYATTNFKFDRLSYSLGTLEDNGVPPGTVDTCVVFETLEHTVNPSIALHAVRKMLSENGTMIGSVPSKEFDELCEATYSANPYHLHKFEIHELVELLKSTFESHFIFIGEFTLGTLFRKFEGSKAASDPVVVVEGSIHADTKDQENIYGSIFFIAGSTVAVNASIKRIGKVNRFFKSIPKIKLDIEENLPLRVAFNRSELMIVQRDKAITDQTKMIDARDIAITDQTNMIDERDSVIIDLGKMVYERDLALNAHASSLCLRDQEIADYTNLLGTICKTTTADRALGTLFSKEHVALPFRDMSLTLYLFIKKLYETAVEDEVNILYFFAREGQLLKKMFDCYQSSIPKASQIKTQYLLVSRRSTFLMSLGDLNSETFEILFRQYRCISVYDFLKSLDLDAYSPQLSAAMSITGEELREVCNDLPSAPIFQKLLSLKFFKDLYETERVARSAAFKAYLASLSNGVIPDFLHVVDVGWKGTIQDNIYNWRKQAKGVDANVKGYYVGLIAEGIKTSKNKKVGLLFSNSGKRTANFHLFNENRALFEILLHADHGSTLRYKLTTSNEVEILFDDFSEQVMVEQLVAPVSLTILDFFRQLVFLLPKLTVSESQLMRLVATRHFNMVFSPTSQEIGWIQKIFHAESFGVFVASRFDTGNKPISNMQRLSFTYRLFFNRKDIDLGFWPWLTIKNNGIPKLHSVYSVYRRIQNCW